ARDGVDDRSRAGRRDREAEREDRKKPGGGRGVEPDFRGLGLGGGERALADADRGALAAVEALRARDDPAVAADAVAEAGAADGALDGRFGDATATGRAVLERLNPHPALLVGDGPDAPGSVLRRRPKTSGASSPLPRSCHDSIPRGAEKEARARESPARRKSGRASQ